jgi:PIN domain nuclease of toxin-antitoxin system
MAGDNLMLLDTCALLWLAQGGGQLSADVCRLIREAPIVYVSAISGFEVGIKYEKRKLILPALPADWFKIKRVH